MASTSLALPGVLFVGEDERARLVAHLGPAAGWMVPKGVLGWSHEVSVVARDALTDDVRRDAKIVMPEEQIPPARMPLTHQAALKSPIVSVSGRLTQKLVESGIRVHTVGADRVTSSFYYIAEGGGEAPVRVEGDLVAAVGAMLGDRADNAAIERVLDGLVDRLLRSLSQDRVSELSLELAAALPRAAADGTGTSDVDLDAFEKELNQLVGGSEKYTPFLQEIAARISDTNERKVDIPLFGNARKVSQGPFELMVGDQKVALLTHERWLASGPLAEPSAAAAMPAPSPAPEPVKLPSTKPTQIASPAPAQAVSTAPSTPPMNMRPLAAPLAPPRPGATPAREMDPAPNPVSSPPAAAPAPQPAPVQASAPVQQSGSTERPAPTPAPAPMPDMPRAAPAPVIPAPAPTPRMVDAPVAPVAPVAKAAAAPHVQQPRENAALATTVKVKKKEGGLPWLWILVLAAAAYAAYRLWYARH